MFRADAPCIRLRGDNLSARYRRRFDNSGQVTDIAAP